MSTRKCFLSRGQFPSPVVGSLASGKDAAITFFRGDSMFESLFLGGLLATAQTPVDKNLVKPIPPMAPISLVQAPKDAAAPAEGEKKEEEKEEEPAQKFLLMRLLEGTSAGLLLDDKGIVMKGYMQGNYTASTANGVNLPMAMNYQANQFLLEQNWLMIEKAVDTKSKESNWGFHIEGILPGSDYRFTLQNNLMDSQLRMNNGLPNNYGVDLPQFYVENYNPNIAGGMDSKVGRFYTIIGTESIDTTQNKLVSRALTFMNNPFTHTGALTQTKIGERWTWSNGITAGNDVFFGPASKVAYLGGIKWESEDGNANFSFNTNLTDPSFNSRIQTANNYDVFEIQYNWKINDKWYYTSDSMYSFINNWDTNGGTPFYERDGVTPRAYQGWANWYGFCNYLTYTFNDKLSTTSRVEFFTDTKGVRTGFEGLYTTLTQGITYKMWDDQLWVRPEFRYDNNSVSKAYNNDGNPSNGLFTFAIDFVVRY